MKPRLLRVLTYHRVSKPEDSRILNPRLISATPSVFERQMRWLKRRYSVVSVESLLDAVLGGAPLPRRAVLVTFDDAYRDFLDHAWPTLERLRLPVTIFVPTGFPDHPERSFWSDRLYRAFMGTSRKELELSGVGRLPLGPDQERRRSLRTLQLHLRSIRHREAQALVERVCVVLDVPAVEHETVLGWEQLRWLSQHGATLGAHSLTHPILTRVSLEEARAEVRDSQNDLRREIGRALPIFCYPSGGHDDAVVSILEQEGIRLAFTTLDGHNDLNSAAPLRLYRTNITRRTSPFLFTLRLQRWAPRVDRWRHRLDPTGAGVPGQ